MHMTSLINASAAALAALSASSPVLAQGVSTLPSDLSAWGMFLQADWVVKSVMIGLAVASVVTWAVLVAKSLELRKTVQAHRVALRRISDAQTLDEATRTVNGDAKVSALLLAETGTEVRQSGDALADGEGLKERVASRLDRVEAAAGRVMTRGTSVLATIGATAPFVGLFGTVWGIMNSFIGISASQTTNLAVVAPGIAEALLATAMGLVAAIPAVVIYNHFARQIAVYKALIGDTSAAVLRLVSRDYSRGLLRSAGA
jgi:biopolymer transport protein ExbB